MNFGTPGMEAVPIIWYWVDDDAGQLDRPTPFCSRNYQALAKHEGGPLGEVIGAERPWRNGSPPFAHPTSGHPCGSASQWRGETPLADVPLFFGYPACCLPVSPPVVEVAGSLVLGTDVIGNAIAVISGKVLDASATKGSVVSADMVAGGQAIKANAVSADLIDAGSVATGPTITGDLVETGETMTGTALSADIVLDADRSYWPTPVPITVECSLVLCGQSPAFTVAEASAVFAADTTGEVF